VDRSELLDAARSIREALPELGYTADAPVATRLDDLIGRMAGGEAVENDLFEVLTAHEPLRRRLDELLPDVDPEKGGGGQGFHELPGHGEPVDAQYFVCPLGDYRYPVLEVGEAVPPCPVHRVPLVAE